MSKKPSKRPDLILGPLPTEVIRWTIGIELDAGSVILTSAAQRHAANRHPEDYETCLPLLASVIADPLYVGDDFRNEGKIEIIGGAILPESFLLVAISIETDLDGRYRIASFYPISRKKAQSRREKGYLKIALKR
ncbi:PBECR2 nuclease fold domain-containing protein [Microvirga flavescens]|uniref:PBECR2 nuclease fold domain-containing protein n=1 Tax=Microvirga flavescens TaxID=2249811 RepID=UPI000DD5BE9A|nr:PBECR2 nuclease fold domain-containing protein [Microvirga flavescens]